MQALAKFKKILYMGFRATLNFQKFKVALNPMYRIWNVLDSVLSHLKLIRMIVLKGHLGYNTEDQCWSGLYLMVKPLRVHLNVTLASPL